MQLAIPEEQLAVRLTYIASAPQHQNIVAAAKINFLNPHPFVFSNQKTTKINLVAGG